jgi:putative aldouronate transport system substrate-binding protein
MKRVGLQMLVCILSLCAAVVFATGQADTTGKAAASATPDFSKRVSIEYMGWSNQGLDGKDSVFKVLEKKFNMDLKYTSVPNGEYQNFSSLRLASGDVPTMFKTMIPNDAGLSIYRQFLDDKLIVNVTRYIDRFGFKNLDALLKSDWAQPLREKDGFYLVPNKIGPAMQAMFVRQDWSDKLNLKEPRTYDEYRNYLQTIVSADPDGNKAIGLTVVGIGGLEHVISAFSGKSGNWVKVNGEWMHKSLVPGFKQGLAYSADLYAKKLLDPEFALMNNTTIQEKLTSGRAAALILNGTAAWWRPMETALTSYKKTAKLGAFRAWPAGPAGEVKQGGSNFFGVVHISSKASEDQRTRALAFMDWTLTDECLDLFYYGIEGEQHKVVNGVKVVDEPAKQKITFGRDLYLFYDLIYNTSQYRYLTIEPLKANYEWLAKHTAADELVGLSNDVTIETAPTINDVYNKWMVDFIRGKADINTQWDKYVADLKNAGYDRYIKEVVKFTNK